MTTKKLFFKWSWGFKEDFVLDTVTNNGCCVFCRAKNLEERDEIFLHLSICNKASEDLIQELLLQRADDTMDITINALQKVRFKRNVGKEDKSVVEQSKEKSSLNLKKGKFRSKEEDVSGDIFVVRKRPSPAEREKDRISLVHFKNEKREERLKWKKNVILNRIKKKIKNYSFVEHGSFNMSFKKERLKNIDVVVGEVVAELKIFYPELYFRYFGGIFQELVVASTSDE